MTTYTGKLSPAVDASTGKFRWDEFRPDHGQLAGLAARWTAVGFAPPVVLSSLRHSAPRLRELGRSLATA